MRTCVLSFVLLSCACSGGGGAPADPVQDGTPPELLLCRAVVGNEQPTGESVLRSVQNLGSGRVPIHSGRQLHARLHKDGRQLVLVRERLAGSAQSRDLWLATVDGSAAEQQLTADQTLDDHPCWSPTGDRILFSSQRSGEQRLWLLPPGGAAREFLAADPGSNDREPDWHRGSDRIVFSRQDPGGNAQLWLVNGDGTGLAQLTAGVPVPAPATDRGDREPAFAPDGGEVAFVRQSAPTAGSLLAVAITTGVVRELLDPAGEVRQPRWSPRGDRVFAAISQPLAGRAGLRLSVVPAAGGEPLLLQPDDRFTTDGIEVLPALAPMPAAAAPQLLDVDGAVVSVAAGTAVAGSRRDLRAADGSDVVLVTTSFNGREIAGLDCRFTLPVGAASDVLALRVRIVARISRSSADSFLRASLFDVQEQRSDTVAEFGAPGTAARTLQFATQSLRHVAQQRQFMVTVIADLDGSSRAELHIDQVEVQLVARAP
ncbi:MAG TPA: hypothetical protein VK348_14065 [Planctomycetota bacterium]|nr:hypothetical protein [Planctomycetota bacterium]